MLVKMASGHPVDEIDFQCLLTSIRAIQAANWRTDGFWTRWLTSKRVRSRSWQNMAVFISRTIEA